MWAVPFRCSPAGGEHKRYLREKRHGNSYLQRAWDKYGEEAFMFVVLERIEEPTKEKLVQREQAWMNELQSFIRAKGYNLKDATMSAIGYRNAVGCTVSKCKNPHLAKGFCNTHYLRLKKTGALHLKKGRLSNKSNRGCKIKNCADKHAAKGYCGRHAIMKSLYGRIHKTDPRKSTRMKPLGGHKCQVKNCVAPHVGSDLCKNHLSGFAYHKKTNNWSLDRYLRHLAAKAPKKTS